MQKKPLQKLLFLPVAIMAVLLVAFGFLLDFKISHILKEQLNNKYLVVSHTLANSLRILHEANPGEIQNLVEKLSFSSGCRVTLIDHDGVVVGDSGVAADLVEEMDNHGGRPEIVQAMASGEGHSDRVSATLGLELHYTAVRFDWGGKVMVLRLARPLSDYYQALWAQRKLLLGFGTIFLLFLIIIGVQATQFMARRLKRERDLLEHRVEVRTREVSLLQNLGTLLSACESHQEAWQAIQGQMGKLLPGTGGDLFLFRSSRNLLERTLTWGEKPAGLDYFSPQQCWALRKGSRHAPGDDRLCQHYEYQEGWELICIPMVAQGENLGILRLLAPEGDWDPTMMNLADAAAEEIGLALANLNLRETLRQQAIIDPLTGLYNRRYLQEALTRELRRAKRKGKSVGVLMCDLDHFKKLNDTFGHHAGDYVLKEVAAMLINTVRAEDIACRFGGEELVVILTEIDRDEPLLIAERICQGVRELELHHAGKNLSPVTLSIGVSLYPEHGAEDSQLLSAADQALYQAKATGRNRVVLTSS